MSNKQTGIYIQMPREDLSKFKNAMTGIISLLYNPFPLTNWRRRIKTISNKHKIVVTHLTTEEETKLTLS